MNQRTRRLTNLAARALRAVRRRIFPWFDTRRSALARRYLGWVAGAARLDFVDGVVGHRMYLDERDSLRLSVARVYEPVVTRLFQREVSAGQTVLDIGANIGYFTLILARQVGPTGRVHAFEPDPTNFALLRRNIALNGYENVTAVERAVWDTTGPLRLFLSEENRGDHRVYDSADGRPSVTIDAVRIDDHLGDEPPRVALIKMDVQGAEAHAVRGMRKLLEHNTQVTLVTEFWPSALVRAGSSPRELLETLASLGFVPFLVDERGDELLPTTIDSLLASYTPANDGSADLVWRRS